MSRLVCFFVKVQSCNNVDVESDLKDIEPLKTSSDTPYVLLETDRQTATSAENNWKKVASRLTIPAAKGNEKNVCVWRKCDV